MSAQSLTGGGPTWRMPRRRACRPSDQWRPRRLARRPWRERRVGPRLGGPIQLTKSPASGPAAISRTCISTTSTATTSASLRAGT